MRIFCVLIVCMFWGCIPQNTVPDSLPVPEPPPDEIIRPVINDQYGPVIVYDLSKCKNVPPEIECWETENNRVLCQTECGDISCEVGAWILCPNGLCYTADP